MKTVIVTGSLGLVGSYAASTLSANGYNIVGIDCDIRSQLFDDVPPMTTDEISTRSKSDGVSDFIFMDLRDTAVVKLKLAQLHDTYDIAAVIHCAAQPSHDWAARDPFADLELNLKSTINLCEGLRALNSQAVFVFLSTNKVYGDTPNSLPLIEKDTRYELEESHPYYYGIPTTMSIDLSKHSLFGCSKLSADVYVQEYARYFGLPTVVLRGGCLTGGRHRGAKLHGFMNYFLRCAVNKTPYEIIGYKGKQVRDNLHADDIGCLLSNVIETHHRNPPSYPVVANMGGGRDNSTSIIELKNLVRETFELSMSTTLVDTPRSGDHIWYITDNSLLLETYDWKPQRSLLDIVTETLSLI